MLFKVPSDCNILWGSDCLNTYPTSSGLLDRINNISAISDFILKSKNSVKPDLSTLGFHFRRSRINSYFNKSYSDNKLLIKGRGLIFHICPSNVALIYLYSAIYGYLSGNVNVIKISSRSLDDFNESINFINSINRELISDFYQSNCFISYSNQINITSTISDSADMRVIWGGDDSVNKIKSIQGKVSSVDLAFPNKNSIAIIDCFEIKKLKSQKYVELLNKFYRDAYLYDHNACSSPKLVFWLNRDDSVVQKFWIDLSILIKNESSISLLRNSYLKFSRFAIDNDKHPARFFSMGLVVRDISLTFQLNNDNHAGLGFFNEFFADNLTQIELFLNDVLQTILYFGVELDELYDVINSLRFPGVHRVVPIGSALNMADVWDGQNFFTSMSRKIILE